MNSDGTKKAYSISPGIMSVIRNTSYILSGQGVQFGVRFIYAIILARALGPHDYGLIAYGTSMYLAIMPLSKLGIEHVVIRAIGCDRESGKKLLQSAQPLRKVSTYLTAILFGVATYTLESDPQTSLILACFSLALLGRSFAAWHTALFTAYEANQFSFRLQAIFRPLEIVLGLTALLLWRDPLSVVIAHAATWWAEVIFGTLILRKHFSIPSGAWNRRDSKTILTEAIPIGVAASLSLMLTQGPLIIFKNMNGPGDTTGNLALAMQIFAILSQLPIAANNASYPVLSRIIARGDGKENFFIETMLRLIIFWGSLLALTAMALGSNLVVLVFGSRYAQAGHLIGMTIWMMIPWSAMNALSKVQMARQKARANLIFLIIGVLCFTISAVPATRLLGVNGPITAVLFGMTVTSLLLLISVNYDGKIQYMTAVVRPIIVLSVSVLTYYLLCSQGDWIRLIASNFVFISCWILFKCVTSKEISIMMDILRNSKPIKRINS